MAVMHTASVLLFCMRWPLKIYRMTFTSASGNEAQIVIYPSNSTVDAANTVVFACAAYGNPAPDFVWTKGDGTNVTTSDPRINITQELVVESGITFVQSILEFCSVGVSDSSQYSCSAVAPRSSATSPSFQLTVNSQPPRMYAFMY